LRRKSAANEYGELTMQLILLQKVVNLGNLGDKVNVKPGYGRNFLVPQGKAVPATAANLAEFEAKRAEYEAKAQANLDGRPRARPSWPSRQRHHQRQCRRPKASCTARSARAKSPKPLTKPPACRRQVRSGDGRRPAAPHRRVRSASCTCTPTSSRRSR
jgi:hypothetical protein